MVFNSILFIIFFAVVCLLMAATKLPCFFRKTGASARRIRHFILLIASYVFYGWWDWRFAFLMLALTGIAYFCSLKYTGTQNKLYAYISFIAPLLVLGYFKYFNFFIESFAALFGLSSAGSLQIILPVGISFYTFQSLSYSIDVYRGKLPAEKDFCRLALYISFFPQLVAGPIVKASDFLPQLQEDRNISLKNIELGIQYFVFGLFKKIVIADNLSVCVDAVFRAPLQYHAISLIFAVIAYSLQIYCDFSGYSDMAIGCAKCLGYDLQRNFNLPYIAKNVSEFWKCWHISLSTWLMEYLYIPLGGNRKGKIRTYINLLITMVLGGLWHGANWTFVAWGTMHGIALCIHKIWLKRKKKSTFCSGNIFCNTISAIFTYAFVCLCWIFFRAETFSIAMNVIKGIFTWQNGIMYISTWTIFSIGIIGSATLIFLFKSSRNPKVREGFYPTFSLNTIWGLFIFFLVLGFSLILAYTGSNPFIYFQF